MKKPVKYLLIIIIVVVSIFFIFTDQANANWTITKDYQEVIIDTRANAPWRDCYPSCGSGVGGTSQFLNGADHYAIGLLLNEATTTPDFIMQTCDEGSETAVYVESIETELNIGNLTAVNEHWQSIAVSVFLYDPVTDQANLNYLLGTSDPVTIENWNDEVVVFNFSDPVYLDLEDVQNDLSYVVVLHYLPWKFDETETIGIFDGVKTPRFPNEDLDVTEGKVEMLPNYSGSHTNLISSQFVIYGGCGIADPTSEWEDYSPPDDMTHNTRFLDFDIVGNDFYIQYYWDQSEIDTNGFIRNPQNFFIEITDLGGYGVWIDPLPDTTGTYDQNIGMNLWGDPIPDGIYTARLTFRYWSFGDSFTAFPEAVAFLDFEVSGTTTEVIRKDQTDTTQPEKDFNCSLTRLDHCVIIAFRFLFIPDNDVFNQFFDLWETIKRKPPAGYFTVLYNEITGVLNDHTNTADVINIDGTELKNTIFDPLKNTLSLIIWGVGGFLLFRRVKNIIL